MLIDLPSLDTDKLAIIREIRGCDSFICKQQAMGIRLGKTIKKVSGNHARGPQIIKIDNLQIAIGFGMAKHIFVEVKQ